MRKLGLREVQQHIQGHSAKCGAGGAVKLFAPHRVPLLGTGKEPGRAALSPAVGAERPSRFFLTPPSSSLVHFFPLFGHHETVEPFLRVRYVLWKDRVACRHLLLGASRTGLPAPAQASICH